ncbi:MULTISPECIES: AAA family ATPase [Saliphagus]|uniref:AAA family ATPase n=1 Tax=Saliphagus infecundisoli TaxID=1849069 RepID=A0ABD5QIJ9_9EURY|nr:MULTISPECIES: MoxR family ATPase [Saliphagus]
MGTDDDGGDDPGSAAAAAAPFADVDEERLREVFEAESYVADDEIVTTVLLALRLGKPLLIEGEPGSGKTELGKVLAGGFSTDLVRLQCYEGLAAENTLYEWNYTKQLLAVQAGEGGVEDGGGSGEAGADGDGDERSVFDRDYLLERPLLEALSGDGDRPPILLIDEVDRADEEFEALLLEVLSDFQVSIPELGTVSADRPPVVIVTSNRTRGLSDALKRRCLYLHIDPPSFEKERAIVERKVPELDAAVAAELCGVVARLREEPLLKQPGVAETLDWARAVRELDGEGEGLEPATVRNTLGCLLKEAEDVERVDDDLIERVVADATAE